MNIQLRYFESEEIKDSRVRLYDVIKYNSDMIKLYSEISEYAVVLASKDIQLTVPDFSPIPLIRFSLLRVNWKEITNGYKCVDVRELISNLGRTPEDRELIASCMFEYMKEHKATASPETWEYLDGMCGKTSVSTKEKACIHVDDGTKFVTNIKQKLQEAGERLIIRNKELEKRLELVQQEAQKEIDKLRSRNRELKRKLEGAQQKAQEEQDGNPADLSVAQILHLIHHARLTKENNDNATTWAAVLSLLTGKSHNTLRTKYGLNRDGVSADGKRSNEEKTNYVHKLYSKKLNEVKQKE